MTNAVITTDLINAELMASVIERVDMALSSPSTQRQLAAAKISLAEARERLIATTFARLSKVAA